MSDRDVKDLGEIIGPSANVLGWRLESFSSH